MAAVPGQKGAPGASAMPGGPSPIPVPPLNVASGPALSEGRSDGVATTGAFSVGGGAPGYVQVVQALAPALAVGVVAWALLR